jgi:hypothetical protein
LQRNSCEADAISCLYSNCHLHNFRRRDPAEDTLNSPYLVVLVSMDPYQTVLVKPLEGLISVHVDLLRLGQSTNLRQHSACVVLPSFRKVSGIL